MTYEELQAQRRLLLLECVSGSRAYGLDLPTSDLDLKGVFILPRRLFYGFGTVEQVSKPSQDEVYYELKRYAELLCRNNPNLLELLATPADCIRLKHPLMERFTPEMFLSKRCEESFAGYAQTQIRKARGLNKKILRPVEPERKGVLDFCYAVAGGGSVPLRLWLRDRGLAQEDCGLAAIPHFREGYALYDGRGLPAEQRLRGIVSGPEAQDVSLSNVPKGLEPAAVMAFNKDGYAAHCREHHEYWAWVEKRNEARYQGTLEHGKNYDAKNMMHTFRLLHMSLEIAREGLVRVRRPDREFLLAIRRGEFDYADLVKLAEERLQENREAFAASPLPEEPDEAKVEAILVEVREALYASGGLN